MLINFLPFGPPNWSGNPSVSAYMVSPVWISTECKVKDVCCLSLLPTGILSGLISIRLFSLIIQTGLFAAAICNCLFAKSNTIKIQSMPSFPPSALPSFFKRSIIVWRVWSKISAGLLWCSIAFSKLVTFNKLIIAPGTPCPVESAVTNAKFPLFNFAAQ